MLTLGPIKGGVHALAHITRAANQLSGEPSVMLGVGLAGLARAGRVIGVYAWGFQRNSDPGQRQRHQEVADGD